MFATVIIAAIVALLFASLGTLIALKIQYRYLQRTHVQHKAWEQAQEGYLRNWETRQEKRSRGVEAKLTARVQQIEKDWQAWEKKDARRIETLTQQYTQVSTNLQVERELARLPLIEETPLIFNSNGQRLAEFNSWQPPALARADLSGRDLSHRYLGQADLREAQLRGASFFMSDLSGACLAGANLTEADLTGANLSYADLRNSVLTNANLQVADLRHAVLLGANLHSAHNLTTQQIYSAIYDHSTQLDSDVDLTVPRLPSISRSMLNQAVRSQTLDVAPPTLPAPITVEDETNHEAEPAQIEAPSAESTTLPTAETPDVAALPESETAAAFSANTSEIPSDHEATNTADTADTADTTDMVDLVETVEVLEVAGETPVAFSAEIPGVIKETPSESIAEASEVTGESPVASTTASSEVAGETSLAFEAEVPEPEVIGETPTASTDEDWNIAVTATGDMITIPVTDLAEMPVSETEVPPEDAPLPEAVAEEEAEPSMLAPLVFPRAIEDVEEDDTFVMPALNGQHYEEMAPSPANETQPQEDTSEPESDPSSLPELDSDAEEQKAGRILDVRKNKRSVPNAPHAPIDITTQKGKYHGNSKRRARAR